MPSPTWDEYLSEASQYLSLARRALETGAALPDPPRHPDSTVPQDRQDECRQLALGYDQLSIEVSTHMANIEERLAVMTRITHLGRSLAQFVDTPL
jgi:hypothetical protein